MMRAAVLLGVLLGLVPAAAQADPMEEQRCVWRCLAQSHGAGDPAYDACVRAQCMGRAPQGKAAAPQAPRPQAAPSRTQGWKTVSDLGYPAVAECLPVGSNARLCLTVACPARGALSLELYGLEQGLTGAPLRLAMSAGQFDLAMPPRTAQEDGYRMPMPRGLAAALKASDEVRIEVNSLGFRLSLAGSGSAIGEVEARCR